MAAEHPAAQGRGAAIISSTAHAGRREEVAGIDNERANQLLREAKNPDGSRRFYPPGLHRATHRYREQWERLSLLPESQERDEAMEHIERRLAEFEKGEDEAKRQYLRAHGRRPRLLDLFCGAGGAAMGYRRLGFDVVGVDLRDQPHYPFTFIRADALALLTSPWFDVTAFDAVHASPPCQHYSDLAHRNGNADEHPDLIGPTRALLKAFELPYVIENVEGAPLIEPTVVCGTPLGLGVGRYRLRRHRLFEMNFPHRHRPDCFCTRDDRPIIDVSGGGPTHAPRLDGKGGRTYKGTVAEKREALGIDWMTGTELVEAIPPAYTEKIGLELLAHLDAVEELVA